MKRWTVFYGMQLFGEFDDYPTGIPDGAYMRKVISNGEIWYEKKWCSVVPVNSCDIPPKIKVLALLLG